MARRSSQSRRAKTPDVASAKVVALHRKHLPALKAAAIAAAESLHQAKLLRHGVIVLHTGSAAGGVMLMAGEGGAQVLELEVGSEPAAPLIEVIGDPARVAAIIRGEKDARMQFFAGGIRVRGDIGYLSEIGMKLGFIDKPLV
jgi:hypothetical protein